MKGFFCELLFFCAGLDPAAAPLPDLTYREVLFHHYQDDHETALVHTLVADELGRFGDDTARFRLAEGSFAFSERMFGYAEQRFEALAEDELTELERMRLAFHLSREFYRRGDWASLEGQLERIDLGRTWLGRSKHHPEVAFMRAQLALARGDFAGSEVALEAIEPRNPLYAYGLYNLGVAYRESGDNVTAADTFAQLASMKATSEDAFDLLQRARLALAYLRRDLGEATDAEALLTALPSDSRYRDQALASYAQLAMDTEDYELAARIWLTLQNQDYWTPSTASARLGFPASLEMLASSEAALTQYRAAEASFEQRLATLDELSERSTDPDWVSGLLSVFAARELDDDRLRDTVARWQSELGHTDWLEWLAAEDVHDVLLQWRDLGEMKRYLDELPRDLDVFEELADEQRRRALLARELVGADGLLNKRERLAAALTQREAEISQTRQAAIEPTLEWMQRLATDDELPLLAELDRMAEVGELALPERKKERWAYRVNRLRGTVYWTIVNDRNARLRALAKEVAEQRVVLEDIDARIARVNEAETNLVGGVVTDYSQFRDRALAISDRVDVALYDRQEMLAQQIRRGMRGEQQRLQQYLLVTRVAIARATDQLAAVPELELDPQVAP